MPDFGYRLIGCLADEYPQSLTSDLYLGRIERIDRFLGSHTVDEVIITLSIRMEKVIIDIVEKCENEGVRVRIAPDFFGLVGTRAVLDRLGDIPLIAIRTEPLDLMRNRLIKRLFDIVFSLVTMLFCSPLMILVAILVKFTSPGPILFKQKRIGANNREFVIYKFRSMIVQGQTGSDKTWTTADDRRITRIGQFLRRTGLDELPQFFNVLTGSMSVVGPRPERQHFVEQFAKQVNRYKVRHQVKSGITGWAQINGWRGDTPIDQRITHDIHYIENWSFWFDLKIIWLTVFDKKTYRNAC
jgi:Undecaprenyl-phosphate glucose phosphotransferase